MIEFSFDGGSILISDEAVRLHVVQELGLTDTSWAVHAEGDLVDSTGETRCVTFPQGHMKVTDTKIDEFSKALHNLRVDGLLAH